MISCARRPSPQMEFQSIIGVLHFQSLFHKGPSPYEIFFLCQLNRNFFFFYWIFTWSFLLVDDKCIFLSCFLSRWMIKMVEKHSHSPFITSYQVSNHEMVIDYNSSILLKSVRCVSASLWPSTCSKRSSRCLLCAAAHFLSTADCCHSSRILSCSFCAPGIIISFPKNHSEWMPWIDLVSHEE